MGALCCCFRVTIVEETAVSTSPGNRNCLDNLVQNIKSKYGAVFSRGEIHAAPSSDLAGASSSNPPVAIIDSSSTNSVIRGQDKGIGHLGPVPRGGNVLQLIPNLLNRCKKRVGSKERGAESSVKYSSPTVENSGYFSSEQDDDCPTCLEEYTPENPKIITKCSHHYHLGCILEWMERSETCPVCGKKMEFDETT